MADDPAAARPPTGQPGSSTPAAGPSDTTSDQAAVPPGTTSGPVAVPPGAAAGPADTASGPAAVPPGAAAGPPEASSRPAATGDDFEVRPMRFQGVVNRIARGLLRTPFVSRAVGSFLVTVYVVGRKSGKRYNVPVAYHPHEGDLLIGTPFRWARNLRTGEPVEVRLRGRRRWADVRVLTDEESVVRDYAIIARANPNFASFNKIGRDAEGNLAAADLHRAWRGGARVLRLTPR